MKSLQAPLDLEIRVAAPSSQTPDFLSFAFDGELCTKTRWNLFRKPHNNFAELPTPLKLALDL
jgi:hypothetical protein